jgi:hypothetical protein
LAQSTSESRNGFSVPIRRTSESQENTSDINQEFVSEDYDTSAISMEEIRREIEQLSNKKGSGTIFLIN